MASSFLFHIAGGAAISYRCSFGCRSGRIINGLAVTQTFSLRTTPKAFANSSPGFALKPWVQRWRKRFLATLKELRRVLRFTKPGRNSFRVASSSNEHGPRVSKQTLGWNLPTLSALFPAMLLKSFRPEQTNSLLYAQRKRAALKAALSLLAECRY